MTVHEEKSCSDALFGHEELLGLYPDDWCALVEKICLPEAPQI